MLSRRRFSLLRQSPLSRLRPLCGAERMAIEANPLDNKLPAGQGGPDDRYFTNLAHYFGSRLRQPIVVENKPGAGGMLGADIVAKARGDAHVVMMSSAASHGIGPVLYNNVPYDPMADFAHIHVVGRLPACSW